MRLVVIISVSGRIDLSRGDPKFIVKELLEIRDVLQEDEPIKKETKEVHIMISGNIYIKDHLLELREFCRERKGPCLLYLHTEGNGKKMVQAGNDIRVRADGDFIERLKEFPQVAKVWKV